MTAVYKRIESLDWFLIVPVLLIMLFGLVTNFSIEGGETNTLFIKQAIFIVLAVAVIYIGSIPTYAALRGPFVSIILFSGALLVLIALLLFAPETNGAQSWFILGPIALQPVEGIKIILIIILARYFASRHIHIRHIRHVVVSLGITGILFLLVFMQPDLGSSVILLIIWAGMIFVSGVSKKHAIALLLFAAFIATMSWQFIPQYQQERILTFLAPLENLQTSGYTAHQSKIAVGSGQLIGKGIGEGTQSKLGFLPLYESDFVFAAYAEEWGFFGVLLLFFLYGMLGWRLLHHAVHGRTNFEMLCVVGVFIFIFSHVLLHIGVNTGVFPVTGITLPFMSYGGSHLLAESFAIALVLGIAQLQQPASFAELQQSGAV